MLTGISSVSRCSAIPIDLTLDPLQHTIRQYDVRTRDPRPRMQPERPDTLPELVPLERHHLPAEHVVLPDQLGQRTQEAVPASWPVASTSRSTPHPPVLRIRRAQQSDVPILALHTEVEPERDAVHLLVDVDLQPLVVDRADAEPVVLRSSSSSPSEW